MKRCKFCQTEIDDAASVCPYCKRTQKSGLIGCLLVLIAMVLWFIAIIIALSGDSSSEDANVKVDSSGTEISIGTEQNIVLEITDAYISEDILDQNQIHLSVNNNSDYTIDAFDFKVESYNTYGQKLSNWMSDSYTMTDFAISPNSTWSSGDGAWTLHFVNNATSFKVALTRYHIKETNETVEIKSKNRIWVKVAK